MGISRMEAELFQYLRQQRILNPGMTQADERLITKTFVACYELVADSITSTDAPGSLESTKAIHTWLTGPLADEEGEERTHHQKVRADEEYKRGWENE